MKKDSKLKNVRFNQFNNNQMIGWEKDFNKKHNLYNTGTDYMIHNKEFLLLRPKGEIVVELINPKFKNLFINLFQ